MTVDDLRRKRDDRTLVSWPGYGMYGRVLRVARDGTWVDMEWSYPRGDFSTVVWSKRERLDRVVEWRDA